MTQTLMAAFSDPHLGRTWMAHTVPSTRDALTEHYEYPIREAIQTYAQRGVPLICGGDWFDKAHNSERQIQRSDSMLRDMALVVAGNHDHAGRESALTSLQLLHGLQEQRSPVTIAEDHLNKPAVSLNYIADIAVYAVPHHATQALFEQAVYEAEAHARQEPKHKVIFLHCNLGAVGGGKPDTNLYLTPPLKQVLEEVFDFVLLGHEHLPRRVGKTIVMGSTQPCGFGELGPRFFYEFYEDGGALQVRQAPIKTQMTHAQYDVTGWTQDLLQGAEPAQLVDLQGTLPVRQAPLVQKLVKRLYAEGALAVRMGVVFDSGTTLDGDAVQGSMANLIDVVRHEISENPDWTKLLDEALSEINEEKV